MRSIITFIVILVVSPFLMGVINQVKAAFAGRKGPGLWRLYFDIKKLCGKRFDNRGTSWVFAAAPTINLVCTILAVIVFCASLSAAGKGLPALPNTIMYLTMFYLLGTGRFFTVLGALDTGSAFEGMGASREVQFSAVCEVIMMAVLAVLAGGGGAACHGGHALPATILTAVAFYGFMLSETCRVPFDDPETHLELTMIHEAMILDYAGKNLAMIHFAAAVKFGLLAAFLGKTVFCGFALARTGVSASLWTLGAMVLVAIITGVMESIMARMRFVKTPKILFAALACALTALTLTYL